MITYNDLEWSGELPAWRDHPPYRQVALNGLIGSWRTADAFPVSIMVRKYTTNVNISLIYEIGPHGLSAFDDDPEEDYWEDGGWDYSVDGEGYGIVPVIPLRRTRKRNLKIVLWRKIPIESFELHFKYWINQLIKYMNENFVLVIEADDEIG